MARKRVPVEVRRRQLVEVALTIAEREGPAAVTARAVAAEAGVSLGLVHYCFESTQELSIVMAERIIEQLAGAALPAPQPPESLTDVRALLGAAVTGLWAQIEATPRRQLLTYEMTTYAVRTPELLAVVDRQYAVSDRAALEILGHVERLSGVSWSVPARELARLIVVAIDGATLRWLTDHDSQTALTSLAHVADLIASRAIPQR